MFAISFLVFVSGLCLWSALTINAFATLFVFTLIGAVRYFFNLYDKYKFDPLPKPINIVAEYIAAKKAKVCPTLYFKDDED